MFQQLAIQQGIVPSRNSTETLAPAARELFERTLLMGRMKKLRAAVTGQSRRLPGVEEAQTQAVISHRYFLGTQTVTLDQIRGTVGKADSFDVDFYPTRASNAARWIGVATAIMNGMTLPPVELIQIGDAYFVVDGNNRVSISRALKRRYIDAVVTVWQIGE